MIFAAYRLQKTENRLKKCTLPYTVRPQNTDCPSGLKGNADILHQAPAIIPAGKILRYKFHKNCSLSAITVRPFPVFSGDGCRFGNPLALPRCRTL